MSQPSTMIQYPIEFYDTHGNLTLSTIIETDTEIDNPINAVLHACQDYILTDAGIIYYTEHNNVFTPQDFIDVVPDDICSRYDFTHPRHVTPNTAVMQDAHTIESDNLIVRPVFCVYDIDWKSQKASLPKDCQVPFDELITSAEKENLSNIKMETIKLRIPDWLLRKYHTDIISYCGW